MPQCRTWNKGNPYPSNPHHSQRPAPSGMPCSLIPQNGDHHFVCCTHPIPPTAFPQWSSQRSPFHTPQHHGAMGDPPQVPAQSPTVTPRDNGHPWALGTGLMHGEAWKSQNRGMLVPQPGWPMWSPSATLGQIPRGVVCRDSRDRGFCYY